MDTPAHGCSNSIDSGGLERFASSDKNLQKLFSSLLKSEDRACGKLLSTIQAGLITQALMPRTHLLAVGRAIFPVALVVIERRESLAPHTIDINFALQMIDLVLQNARVPSLGFDYTRLAMVIKTGDTS